MRYIIMVVFLLITITGYSQMMAPQDPGSGPQLGDPPIGGGAPVGSGVIVLLTLGAIYGSKKVYEMKKVNT